MCLLAGWIDRGAGGTGGTTAEEVFKQMPAGLVALGEDSDDERAK